ncbi:DUF6264 family protein [Microbacterium sp. 18062]|uniref:DUF6264 family protein n=1 Tax=Microbacterium sp. 18062 TaxID=2681410 RepID=UPI001357B66A|nr:DUF6264 family protein [Microbacterium sp. 18062]
MSGSRPGDDPGVYTMPPEAFRVGPQVPSASAEQETRASAESPAEREPRRPATERPARRRKGWDIALTVVLLLLLIAAAVVASGYALLVGLSDEACGGAGRICQDGLFEIGVWVSFTAPWLVVALALFVGAVLLVVRRRGFWVPLAGAALMAALCLLGAFLVWAAT